MTSVSVEKYVSVDVVSLALVLFCVARLQPVDTQAGLPQSICQWETFNATCRSPEDVVQITSARYGRMRVGRCVPVDYYIGCSADVTDAVDARCSGRRTCVVSVPDPEMFAAQPCRKDLIAYMEASYKCVRPLPCSGRHRGPDDETSQEPVLISTAASTTGTSGYLSGRCYGNAWQVRAARGQRIELTLYDYGSRDIDHLDRPPGADTVGAGDRSFDDSCPPLVRITEKLLPPPDAETGRSGSGNFEQFGNGNAVADSDVIVRTVRTCDSPLRQRIVYASKGHIITVTVLTKRSTTSGLNGEYEEYNDEEQKSASANEHGRMNFLLHYQVTGCAEITRPENALLVRSNDVTVIWCNTTGERWHLVCRENRWIGGMPTNCSSHADRGSLYEPSIGDNIKADHVIADFHGHLLVGRHISIGMAMAIILGCLVGLISGSIIVLLIISIRRRKLQRKYYVQQLLMSAETSCGVDRDCSGAGRGGGGGERDSGREDSNDIYRLLDVLPSHAPEMTQSLQLPAIDSEIDDVTAAAQQRSSCLCSCHTLPRTCHVISHDGGCPMDYAEEPVPEGERRSATIDRRCPTACAAASTPIPDYRRQTAHPAGHTMNVKGRMAASTGELAEAQCALWTSSELGSYGTGRLSRGRGGVGFYGLQ